MSTIFSNPAGSKFISFIWMIKNKNFPPLVKAKNQLQNFERHLRQKRRAIRRLNVPNFLFFFQKN